MQATPGRKRAALHDDTIELADDDARSVVSIVPSRGAIVTRFRAGDRELLYMDDATLRDRAKNVRGGIPILFPSPGRLTGDRFSRGGISGAMKQHGLARDAVWTTRSTSVEAGTPTASLAWSSDEATRAAFPWSFSVSALFELRARRLVMTFRIENVSRDQPLPFAFGLHPYFRVEDKAHARITTHATRAFDNVTKRVVPFHGFDLTAGEVDMHLLDHGSTSSELTLGDGGRIALTASPELTRWVVWTLPGKDFVCVEPWTAPADALNTGEGLIELGPGESRTLWVAVESVGE